MTRIFKPAEPRIETFVSAGALAVIYAVLLSRFDLGLLFSPTILTGGDSASWYQILHTLATDFLPRGRIFGFSQANFFGYLEGQQYFPLPFLAAAGLGLFMPLAVALKLATVAGGLALPLTLFAAARSATGRSRSGVLAAGFALLFLFNESYSIFGGNWLSTFAGEFCFSWAIALVPLVAASTLADQRDPTRRGMASGILLGLTGLCHSFVFMPAFFLPFYPAFGVVARMARKRNAANHRSSSRHEETLRDNAIIARIIVTYGCAFAVMAFWLVPMIATRTWAQPISMIWRFASFGDFAHQTLAWFWVPAVLVFLASSLNSRVARLFAYALAACGFLFIVAPGLGMPDIRFVPSALILASLGVSILSEKLLDDMDRRFPATSLAILFAGLACAGAVFSGHNAPAWFRWNYSGYEAKAEWKALQTLSEQYKGDIGAGRILWEKQDQRDNRDFGSERGFENLYLFTGHPSAEGIHYGSSFMARATTYLQSSYSLNPVDPEPERIYSKIDPDSWPARFDLLNARYIITHSAEMTGRFASHPDFEVDSVVGKFTVFRYRAYRGHYVKILGPESISTVSPGSGGWKTSYYRFFRDWELYDQPFVDPRFADASLEKALGNLTAYPSYDTYRTAAIAAIPTSPQSSTQGISDEALDSFSISFRTEKPGMPHLIAVSYAPGWKSSTGERIYPVAPGFMLIIPRGTEVLLRYGRTAWEIAGLAATIAGAIFMAAWILSTPRARLAGGRQQKHLGQIRMLAVPGFFIFIIVAGYLVIMAGSGYPALAADIGAARKADISSAEGREETLIKIGRWATQANVDRYDNMLVFDAYRIKAAILAAQGQVSEAENILEMLKARYPHARITQSLPSYAPR